jgi:hypothetical protein
MNARSRRKWPLRTTHVANAVLPPGYSTRVAFRPVVDLEGEPLRESYPELWRLLSRQAPKSKPWRDFWKVWIASFVPVILAFTVLDTTPFSPLGLAVLIAVVPVTFVIGSVFRRLGQIADRRHDP